MTKLFLYMSTALALVNMNGNAHSVDASVIRSSSLTG